MDGLHEFYSLHNKVILRTHAYPFKAGFNKDELFSFFSQPETQEALFLSSPDLLNALHKKISGDLNADKEKRLTVSLLKYALRMHSRCTPFGLFSGCGIVDVKWDAIRLNRNNSSRTTRLDMHFTCALAQTLAQNPFLKEQLKFYPNTSLYPLGDRLRYIEYYYDRELRVHRLSSVENSEHLEKILDLAGSGLTQRDLANSILNDEVSSEDASIFVNELISSQILVSELEPAITGDEPLTQIIRKLREIQKRSLVHEKDLDKILILLESTMRRLVTIDVSYNNDVSKYTELADALKSLGVPFELNKLFQTDMFLDSEQNVSSSLRKGSSSDADIKAKRSAANENSSVKNQDSLSGSQYSKRHINCENSNFQADLEKELNALNQLTTHSSKTNLKDFKENFVKRYGEQEIGLLEALDNETGIGYGENINGAGDYNPLVNDLHISHTGKNLLNYSLNKTQRFLFEKLLKANAENEKVLVLNSSELKGFECDWTDFPDSFTVMYSHHGTREGKPLLSLQGAGGSTATYLLGRFTSGSSTFHDLVSQIACNEQELHPEQILAEIVHLPESRAGNILMRTRFRDFEIPYLCQSDRESPGCILPSDLTISVRHNRIVLRSIIHRKEVIPRMGNAHSFSVGSLPVYHFLCDLQAQDTRSDLYFDWGELQQLFPFLPRVEMNNIILSFATWQLKKKDFAELLTAGENLAGLALKWRARWNLPKLIYLVDGDNQLLVDLENAMSVEMLVSMIKKRKHITLKECLHDQVAAMVVDEKGGTYVNEFIAIYEKSVTGTSAASISQQQEFSDSSVESNVQQNFQVGLEWLYFKIYCGVKTSETVLLDCIAPLVDDLTKNGLIDNWFFIRYADPDLHLRVRFHTTDLKHIGTIISKLNSATDEFVTNGVIWNIQLDTYRRELQRYGSNTMVSSEDIFGADSVFTLGLLNTLSGDGGEDARWLIAIKAVDELLSNFGFSLERKKTLLELLKRGYAFEFNMDKNLKSQLDFKYRKFRENIDGILFSKDHQFAEHTDYYHLLVERSNRSKRSVENILKIANADGLLVPLEDLVASHIHMMLNRIFKSKQRLHELVVYDFLWRSYRSKLARGMRKTKTAEV